MSENITIRELYDEESNVFYPITHIDAILGDKSKLSDMGTYKTRVELKNFITSDYTGDFELYIMNNFVYVYSGSIQSASGVFPYNEEIVLANNIPSIYRSIDEIITFKAIGNAYERVNIWLNEKGELVCVITPKAMLEVTNCSLSTIDFDGLFVRLSVEEEN